MSYWLTWSESCHVGWSIFLYTENKSRVRHFTWLLDNSVRLWTKKNNGSHCVRTSLLPIKMRVSFILKLVLREFLSPRFFFLEGGGGGWGGKTIRDGYPCEVNINEKPYDEYACTRPPFCPRFPSTFRYLQSETKSCWTVFAQLKSSTLIDGWSILCWTEKHKSQNTRCRQTNMARDFDGKYTWFSRDLVKLTSSLPTFQK